MTILLVQTFLLMLLAFLLGASLACLTRRGLAGTAEAPQPSAVTSAGAAVGTDRFGRALTGGPDVPLVLQRSPAPVVEVQPPPAAPPPPAPPAPQPHPQSVVARPSPPPSASPEPVQPAPAPEPPPRPAVVPPPAGPSYTELAVAAAAAAAAASAAAQARTQEEEEPPEAEEAADAASRFGAPVAPAPELAADGPGDDLTRIRAIDAETKERLNRLGVTRFAEIGAWRASDVMRLSQSLGFQGRIEQENWVGQAQILARGGATDATPRRDDAAALAEAASVPPAGDRLHRIIGIDPNSEALLYANGVTRIADIAAWTAADIERFEGLLGAPGRISRENWVEQARFLTRGASGIGAAAAVAVVAATASHAASEAAKPAPSADEPEGYTGLRSVRSEALRGPALAVPPIGDVDDLKRIRGIGVLIEKKLHSLGITMYEQVANWTQADIDRVSQILDFKGRIERENWVEQARILASGGQTEFSRRVDRGDA